MTTMKNQPTTMKTRLCFLNVQPHCLLVGQPGGFATAEDFHRFAAECGFTGITMPTGFVDIDQAISSSSYRDDFQANLIGCGLTDGLVRMEMHVDGQNVCVAPYRVKRTGHFVSPDFATTNVANMEGLAKDNLFKAIDASAAFGFKYLPGFCGGRGFAAAMAKWPAWPKHLPAWVMGLLALKWQPILEYAADRGVTITFEFGHPENDLLTGANFVLFYSMLSDKAKLGVGINADASHFLNIGINPMPHLDKAAETGCKFTNHFKWGASVDRGDGTASTYGGWTNWSQSSTTFFTFATVGPDWLAREFYEFLLAMTRKQGDECFDVVYEGEDATIINPKQAMQIGAANCRAAITGDRFIKLNGVVDEEDFVMTTPMEVNDVALYFPGGRLLELESWAGGPFDQAFDSPLKPYDLLEMDCHEVTACRQLLADTGHEAEAEA
ncbi:MAG: hypothetical protein WC711_02170 [Candidatus Staskawiczbacteria bacterium]|jgi:sugar phosphate isomerase/epimerase